MIDINSAIGIIQLKKIEKNLKIRKKIFNAYKKLSNLPIEFQNLRQIQKILNMLIICVLLNL